MKKFAFGLLPLVISVFSQNSAFAAVPPQGTGATSDAGSIAIGDGSNAQGFNSIALGTNADSTSAGIAIGTQSDAREGVAIGSFAVNDGDNGIALGSNAAVTGLEAISIGYDSDSIGTRSIAIGSRSASTGDFSMALGESAVASGFSSVAIGSGSVASDDFTVSFGAGFSTRRLTNISAGVDPNDAVTVSQMYAITDAMAVDIADLDGRITVLESAGGGAADLTPAYEYTDASSAQTLNQANTYTDASSVQTLSSANSYTDASSAQTLNSANAYTDISSAQTLSSANSYTDAAVAGVARESRAYTDQEIAKSEEFLSAGIAAVAAQPNLPALAAGQKAVAVGTGHFNGADAVGVAFGFAPRDGVVLSGGVSGVSGEGKPVFRTSASYVW